MSTSATPTLAERAASILYGLAGRISPLPGYDDENYRVATPSATYVLKIAAPDADPEPVGFQIALLEFLNRTDLPFETPHVVATTRGEPWDVIEDDRGRKRIVRLLTWIPGPFLAAVPQPSNDLLYSIGRGLARLDKALEGFSFPGMNRTLDWDLRQALLLRDDLSAIGDPRRRALAESGFIRFEEGVLPILLNLPTSVIHNDANEHNILVSEHEGTTGFRGLIDFGDAVRTNRVIEPAVAATYAMMLREDGESASEALLSGFQAEYPLEDRAISILADLIRTRLCVSVVQSARKTARGGPDAYVTLSENGAWTVLESMGEDEWRRFGGKLERTLTRL